MLVQYNPWIYKAEEGSDSKEDIWGVEILDGEFAGSKISFNNITLPDDGNNLELDFTVVHIPNNRTKEYYENPLFEETLSHIITDILNKAISLYENRDNNTSESS